MVLQKKEVYMSKYTRFSRSVFKACDLFCQPACNWFRQSKKGLTTYKDVAYGAEKSQVGDIYFKSELADEKKPILLNIHGGGFVGGDKNVRGAVSVWYANMGYFVYNINYSLAPDKLFPQCAIDSVNALNFLVDNAERYNLDLDKLVVAGDSAGGYLASAVAVSFFSKDLQDFYGVSPKIKAYAAVFNCGAYDIETLVRNKVIFDLAPKIALDLCGVSIEQIDEYEHLKFLSTLDFVTEDFPKSFIAYAKKDMFVQGQGEKLIEKLNSFGVYNEHYEASRFGDNHVFPLFWDLKSSKECNAKIKQFLIKVRDGEI